MGYEYSIPQLVTAAVNDMGYNPALSVAVNRLLRTRNQDDYDIALKEATEALVGYDIPEVDALKNYGSADEDRLSGVPIFQPLVMKVDNISLQLDSCVVSFSRSKIIKTTIVDNRDSSVKELITNGDYVINFSGMVSVNSWKYPLDKVVDLENIFKKKANIEIEHEILNAVGIFEIVIQDYNIEETSYINIQPFSFSALSDDPVPLIAEDNPSILNS